jgi:hypothetical protein
MTDLTQFSALVALWGSGLALFTYLFTRLERHVDGLEAEFRNFSKDLRRDLAEEFRTQRAEVAAQVSAIASAINASRDGRA